MNAKVEGRALFISILKEVYPELLQREVAEKLGVSQRTISWTLRRTGTPWQRVRWSPKSRRLYVRHAPLRFAERDQAIVADALATGRSLEAIGRDHSISRERVRQILAKAGVKKQSVLKRDERFYHCARCGKPHKRHQKVGRCQECRQRETPRITMPCGACGAPVTRRLSDVQRNMRVTGRSTTTLFCNLHCRGVWLGRNYGVRFGDRGRRGRGQNGATP